jgi:hypothetical protein
MQVKCKNEWLNQALLILIKTALNRNSLYYHSR